MAFKSAAPAEIVPASPEEILLTLPRRTIPGVLLHQGEIMRSYATQATADPDVALQLPTGSGKTLVGLMIAEWRRRKFRERVVYLCPTKQLVNQVVEQARTQYGLTINGFTGSKRDYDPQARAEYRNADRVAVTTYNSLFNTSPFFSDPDVVVIDDAHAAENYIGEMWTVRIQRTKQSHRILFEALAGVLRPHLDPFDFSRLWGRWDSNPEDRRWVDKLPTPTFAEIRDELTAVVDAHADELDIKWAWSMVRGHLNACHLYISSTELLIRPLLAPTWQHAPYQNARQRIFMSATLGAGGDLERLTGRRTIKRLQVPEGWDRQGIGRRFFIFPDSSLEADDVSTLRQHLMRRAGRSLVLVPSDQQADEIKEDVRTSLGFATFTADDIEESKQHFVATPQAVAVIANRYDGIDFPGNDCRLLFIEGLPRAANLQERFIMLRMGASQLFNDRVQTRVLQAIGRCTRSLQDYSAVVVSGEELPDYLADRRRRVHFHPELQAELEFGNEQSVGTTMADIIENFDIFLANDARWDAINNDILRKRTTAVQQPFPVLGELQAIVGREIEYQNRLWQSDFEGAVEAAEAVLGGLTAPDLRGYRALWHYLAGSAAWYGERAGIASLGVKARSHFHHAKRAASDLPWLVKLARYQAVDDPHTGRSPRLLRQIERVEGVLERLGTVTDRDFNKREQEILQGLASKDGFEQAQVRLGEMLGFTAGKREVDASPDPWWAADDLCFVFEDHAGATNDVLDATKARQAFSHPNWIRDHVALPENATIMPVLVTPVTKAKSGAIPHLHTVSYWEIESYRTWAGQALRTLRDLRRTFGQPGDLVWRANAAERFEQAGMGADQIHEWLKGRIASGILQSVP
ncbi:DEAD/DEAH box helicase [Rhizobium leguminosarum]|uniref:DEAD/DEAH box helicase n=1 Tax=Rhizobium leguminosarum TaxID=384 RepID=UPI000E0F7B9D|nr:DEAD/DEAH box helicase [Rhizobium leguminosarum]NKK92230.1 DEAD/DEAH box helicase [Rhizobium leguminosarum bv. viciae]TAU98377.1 DEAD/DEAH box helicase [Rhizobium leguminosarum]TAW54009.1 DEAD/DEAH box helicase [Rhizobium leguminosarum]TAX52921.1 DEAD/DEAH box helicase [Rhizobium leguminosarum]TAY39407.1 DEAD/DEAH box helicase [Rhizobium leguminosarum]